MCARVHACMCVCKGACMCVCVCVCASVASPSGEGCGLIPPVYGAQVCLAQDYDRTE